MAFPEGKADGSVADGQLLFISAALGREAADLCIQSCPYRTVRHRSISAAQHSCFAPY